MKNKKNSLSIIFFGCSLFYSSVSFSQWTYPAWNPGNTATEWTNGAVGIQTSAILNSTAMSLCLGNSLSLNGTHLLFNSSNGVIDWGNGGHLYFRYLSSQGDVTTYTNYMVLTNNGLLGIGLGYSPPLEKLDVGGADANGEISVFRNGNNNIFLTANLAAAGFSNMAQLHDNGIFWTDYGNAPNNSSGLVIAPWTVTGYGNGIRLDGTNGNLWVNKNTNAAIIGTCAESPALGWATSYLGFNTARSSSGSWTINSDGANNGGATILSDIGGNIRFINIPKTGNSTQTFTDAQMYSATDMLITGTGQVVIGSQSLNISTPGNYKLYVAGGILTEQVRVALVNTYNWADYVFNKKYNLKPLSAVEQYIKKNNHLPGIPSADEVAKNGIDVATMDAALLKKIEELTLYVIGQQKEIGALKEKLNAITNK